jgi:two-component system, OmpR family, alkaline phosphatase synthesis response regulator PhoP
MKLEGHVLIIDDESGLRHTMAQVLQRAGYEVTTAANGKEGFELVKEHPFDLLYLDIRMPDMNGLELLKTIHGKLPDLPVVLVTAHPDLDSAVKALRLGAIDYLLKPLKPSEMVDHTKAILAYKKKERLKHELQKQIKDLEAQLRALEIEEDEYDDSKQQPAPVSDERILKRGKLALDMHVHRVTVNDRVVNLPPTSFNYLLVLARHLPNIVEYQTLVSEAQGYDTDMREAQELSRWHIHQIRQSIDADLKSMIDIVNVRGVGYRLATE